MAKISNIIQGVLWLFGISLHNRIRNECCPDFSCCFPTLKKPFVRRCGYLKEVWIARTLRDWYYRIFHPTIWATPRCSGYRWYPDGRYCPGCMDCKDKSGGQ